MIGLNYEPGVRVVVVQEITGTAVLMLGAATVLPARLPIDAVSPVAALLLAAGRPIAAAELDSGGLVYGCDHYFVSPAEWATLQEGKATRQLTLEQWRAQHPPPSVVTAGCTQFSA